MSNGNDRKERGKRGKSSQRTSAATHLRGVTTAAVNTGLASAFNHLQYTEAPLFYAVSSDGSLLQPLSIQAFDVQALDQIPNVYGQFTPMTVFLHDLNTLNRVATLSSLYEVPLEIQLASNDGVGRFGIPFYQRSSPNPLKEQDLQHLVHEYFPKSLVDQKSLSAPTQKQLLFDQSAELVRDVFLGEAVYLPWAQESFGVQ